MFYDPDRELSIDGNELASLMSAMDTSEPDSPPSQDGRAKRSVEPHHDAARKQPRTSADERGATMVRAVFQPCRAEIAW